MSGDIGYGPAAQDPTDQDGCCDATPGYGPALADSMADSTAPLAGATAIPCEPLVVAIAPGRGWAQADAARRGFAALFVVIVALLLAIWLSGDRTTSEPAAATPVLAAACALFLLVGPPAFYSAARIVRPHPAGTGMERKMRHGCAAVASAYGWALLAVLFSAGWSSAFPESLALIYFVVPSVLGPLTLCWGLVAGVVRAVRLTR